ncbi:MAG: CDC27 family protein [Candidatus Omnitrophica bacterium]|nr:CDC27 family protein [Candidatus Omnitrophota bacterium]MDD5352345.1 CDC27 family protein [Candidatus Omnitrophota bacterium]MDD5549943.1 CDC27 family protein [Candidatus Omnitrophota bacterium]
MSLATFLNKINPRLKKANYTISALLIIILFFVLMVHLSKEVSDLDIWLHLKSGEQMVLYKQILLNDPFSFTKESQPWINHEWLFQILTYTFYNKFGFDGLILMQNIVFIAIFIIIFVMGLRNRNFLFVSAMLFILLLNLSYRFTIRPDMFSALFLVLFILILKEKSKSRYLYLLPFLQIIWTNLHGFFLLGPLVIFIFALTQKNKRLWLVLITSLLATIINPQLIKGAFYPFVTLSQLFKDKFILNFVQELEKPFGLKTLFNLKDWIFYKALIIISLFSFRFNQKRFNRTLFLLWLIFFLLSLSAIRNIVYFAIVATIVIFYNANERFSYDQKLSNEKLTKNKYYYIARLFLILAFSLCMIKNAILNMGCYYYDFDSYKFKSCMWGISPRNFPHKAVDFILKEKLPQQLFNDFNSGSYLIGRSFPLRKVFIDGRTEFYGNNFLKEYKQAAEGDKKTIEGLIDKYKLQGFLLTMCMSNFDEKLAKYLFDNTKWKTVYFNDDAIIFLKNIPENKNIIKKFHIDLKAWHAPKVMIEKLGPKITYPTSFIKRGNVLKEIGCFKAAISEAKEALKIMPNCADAFELLGSCYLALKEYGLALENYRIAVALEPQVLGWRNKFALALYKLGYFREAEMQLYPIIKSRPKDAENYYALALVYRKQNKLKKAENMISRACGYSKNNDFEYLKLWADILLELKDYNKAVRLYKLTQQIEPQNREIREKIRKIEKTL